MKFLLCWSKEETRKINLQEESPCHRLHPFIFSKTASGRNCPTETAPAWSIWPSGTGVRDLAYNMLAALREWDLPELAAEIAPDWDLPTEAVQSGLETLRSHLELVRGDVALLYEML